MPAYQFDPYMLKLHQIKGGKFSDYKDKTYLPLTDQQFLKHLKGEQLMGIYPLLADNSSWFIAADFDKESWADECKSVLNICYDMGIPAYLERSKSGNGGHVWIFFDAPYPAFKSRTVFTFLLQQSGAVSAFDKNSSFDRLFPNQDRHSGKFLGNLIALPFYRPAFDIGNSCFVDENLKPWEDQWKFLSSIKRVSATQMDKLFDLVSGNKVFAGNAGKAGSARKVSVTAGPGAVDTSNDPGDTHYKVKGSDVQVAGAGALRIRLSNKIYIDRNGMTPDIVKFIRDELNFTNSEYYAKKKSGKSTWGLNRYFNYIEESEDEIILPRGFIGRLIRYCKQANINFNFQDQRKKHDSLPFLATIHIREHQKVALLAADSKDFGVITAPPGSGKTVIGIQIIASKQQSALIVVHRKQLMDQWIERIKTFLGIPGNEIGMIGQGKSRLGKLITVAMVQSLGKYLEKPGGKEISNSFGTLIVDECHHIPAESFRNTISAINAYYLYGLTATPFRKGNDGRGIFVHLGEIIADIKPQDIGEFKKGRVIVRETALSVPFNPKTDAFETLSRILIHDSERNKLILKDVSAELNKGRKAVIITERKEHIDTLNQYLKQKFETITLSGDDTESNRKSKWQLLTDGNYQVLITTGQFFGEGSDLQSASCIFLAYPFSFKGKLIQYIGRVQRSEVTPVIYDYRDIKIDYLNRLFLKRNVHYRNFEKQATLFDDQDIPVSAPGSVYVYEKKIKVPVANLDFRFGAVAFNHFIPDLEKEVEFEIENDILRPEFDVLKPYFMKLFRSKFIEADVFAEFKSAILISQSADSSNLENLNMDIIESVKKRSVSHYSGNTRHRGGNIHLAYRKESGCIIKMYPGD